MNITHLMRQTVTVAAVTGISDAGDPIYGNPVEVAARVEGLSARQLRGAGGEQLAADFLVWTEAPIPLTARVWLPGVTVAAGTAKRPIKAETVPAVSGAVDFFKTYL